MAITVAELVAIPYLGTRFGAGLRGGSRKISWAHSCEVPNPWQWFDEGDLLMTNGFSIPADAAGQVDFLRQLDKTGLSGIAIGDDQRAPPLTAEALTCAEDLRFPILFTAYEVPFIALSRVVAEANQHEEQRRLVHTVRLYDRLREWMVEHKETSSLTDKLGEELRCRLYVLDPRRAAAPVLPGLKVAPKEVGDATMAALAERERPLPALTRIPVGRTTALAVPVPSQEALVLVAVPRRDARPDLALLQHAATIAALQIERTSVERDQALRLGSELLAHLVEGTLEAGSATQQLTEHHLGGQRLVCAASAGGSGAAARKLHIRLTERDVPHLIHERDSRLLILLQAQPMYAGALREEFDTAVPLGISDPFHGVSRVPDAAREAQWALEAARTAGASIVHYGDSSPLFLPRTLREAEAAVTQVIGPLLDYDREHRTELVESLRVFLTSNRSWQRAAGELFVHKQTLVYRMHRVEELTARHLDRTGDVAELWLALQALDIQLGTSPPGPDAPWAGT